MGQNISSSLQNVFYNIIYKKNSIYELINLRFENEMNLLANITASLELLTKYKSAYISI